MQVVNYGGTFEGLLTVIFEIYEYKIAHPNICREDKANSSLFSPSRTVITDPIKASLVLIKLKDKLTANAMRQFYHTFLSEIRGIENHLFRFAEYVIKSHGPVESNYSHPDVLMVQQTSRKVYREKHRMEAFVRFQLTKDNLYYSIIQPDYNVLPLVLKHFQSRYADEQWLIYDTQRKYGIFYDLKNVREVDLHFSVDTKSQGELLMIHDSGEELYQRLWQQYFSSVNIPARKNMKLHISHMPKRYWKNLTEKRPRF